MTARTVLLVALVAVGGCAIPHPCPQPVFSTEPGHAHPPIEVICHG